MRLALFFSFFGRMNRLEKGNITHNDHPATKTRRGGETIKEGDVFIRLWISLGRGLYFCKDLEDDEIVPI